MYAVVEQDYFGHKSVFESQRENDAYEWMKGLEKTHGEKYKIIQV